MRILFYEWGSYLQYDVKWICREKGIRLDTFTWSFTDKNKDEQFEDWFSKNIEADQFDVLLSINYWPMLSVAAQRCGMKYIAWCYDNPLNVVEIERTLGNTVNSVFFFDRIQAEDYIQKGFENVYYLPLAVNCERLSKMSLSGSERERYGAEVAFIGSLYESRMQELRSLMNDRIQGYLDAALNVQQNLYGVYLFDALITDELVVEINQYIQERHPETSFRLLREALTFAMASEVTRNERLLLLALLGKRFDTRLYSYQSSAILKDVKCFPPVDYVTEMPKIFQATKINLNPSLRCIQSGIPLRALDVMGAGGFLLSNYQTELAEFFVEGQEMVIYEDMEDAVEKVGFYLKNDDLRRQIAENGKKKVAEEYSLQGRFRQILEFTGVC